MINDNIAAKTAIYCASILIERAPILFEHAPTLIECAPMLIECALIPIEHLPILNEHAPMLFECAPILFMGALISIGFIWLHILLTDLQRVDLDKLLQGLFYDLVGLYFGFKIPTRF